MDTRVRSRGTSVNKKGQLHFLFVATVFTISCVLIGVQHLYLVPSDDGGLSQTGREGRMGIYSLADTSSTAAEDDTTMTSNTNLANTVDTSRTTKISSTTCQGTIPKPFCDIVERSRKARETCVSDGFFSQTAENRGNNKDNTDSKSQVADLTPFGLQATIESYMREKSEDGTGEKESTDSDADIYGPESSFWSQCQVPTQSSCHITQFSIVVMGYNPERLTKLHRELITQAEAKYEGRVQEIILVWNGGTEAEFRQLLGASGSPYQAIAKAYVELHDDPSSILRIWFPLDPPYNLPNSLFNRYHPAVKPKSEAILMFDDDGPFFMQRGIEAGFNLWRRHSNCQVGGMGRSQHLGRRQEEELKTLLDYERQNHPDKPGTLFQSHCRDPSQSSKEDKVEYDYHLFPYFGSHMVLPSGSFLHRDFLCFLWHPILAELRNFVVSHPVFPDDITVSSIVTQISGNAPRVYCRRAHSVKKEEDKVRRRLLLAQDHTSSSLLSNHTQSVSIEIDPVTTLPTIATNPRRRKLLYQDVENWPDQRTHAVNAVWGYFGSFTTGSLGWCYNASSQVFDKNAPHQTSCAPFMPPTNLIEYQNEGGFEYDICGDGYVRK
jgi:hypothetical protein